jgi:hypothetical protein
MKTDELLRLLAADAQPVPQHAAEKRFALALLAGLGLALLWVLWGLGARPDLGEVIATRPFWDKLLMPVLVSALGAALLWRLAHPGMRAGTLAWAVLLPVALLWLWAAWVLWQAAPAQRLDLLLGQTWRVCSLNIVLTALPLGLGLFWALRGLAPTQPVACGAAAGWLAGALAALLYSLHCAEMAAPFLAVWYVLGMAACAGLGAALGARSLRW